MAINNNLNDFFADIADAIREKKQYSVATTPAEWQTRLSDKGITCPLSILQEVQNGALRSMNYNHQPYYLLYMVYGTKITFVCVPQSFYNNANYTKYSNGYYYPMCNGDFCNWSAPGNGLVYDYDNGVVSGTYVDYSGSTITTKTADLIGNTYSGPYTAPICPRDFASMIRSL